MNVNKKTFQNDEVDLRETILILWREKFLILVVTLILTVTGYILNVSQIKFYKTTIVIRSFLPSEISMYHLYFPKKIKGETIDILSEFFIDEFQLKLLSLDHIVNFANKYDKLNEFKSYLETKNINMKDYFEGKFEANYENNKNKVKKKNVFSLTFAKPLPGQAFLNDYILYTIETTGLQAKEKLINLIEKLIEIYTINLKIAKDINLVNPMPGSYEFDSSSLFYQGEKVLTEKLKNLKHLLQQTSKSSFIYNNIILEKASKPIQISKSNFTFFGFVCGLILSFFCIFIKTSFKKNAVKNKL